MKKILIFLMAINLSYSGEIYKTPPEILKSRDNAIASLDRVHKYLIDRYFFLMFKDDRSKQEEDELQAISLIVNGNSDLEIEEFLELRK